MFGDSVRPGRLSDCELATFPVYLLLFISPIDMEIVCGVWPTLLGCHSAAPSGNLLYGYGVQFGFCGVVSPVLNGPSSRRFCRDLVHPEGTSRNRYLRCCKSMDNRLFFHDDVYQRRLFR